MTREGMVDQVELEVRDSESIHNKQEETKGGLSRQERKVSLGYMTRRTLRRALRVGWTEQQ